MYIHKFTEGKQIESKKPQPLEVKNIKMRLDTAKDQLDNLDERQLSKSRAYEAVYTLRKIIENKINFRPVSGAFLKTWEMLNYFVNADDNKSIDGKYTVYDGAAFPGGSTLALHAYFQQFNVNYDWYAGSYLPEDEKNQGKRFLGDSLNLYKNYPTRWLIGSNFGDGDVRKVSTLHAIRDFFNESVNLYFSDIGFHTDDYNSQEEVHLPVHLGQFVIGLHILCTGGMMMLKHFTLHTAISQSILYAAYACFDEVYLCKPITSKADNSEIYLVCKGKKDKNKFPIIDEIILCIEKRLTGKLVPIKINVPSLHDELKQEIINLATKQKWFLDQSVAAMKGDESALSLIYDIRVRLITDWLKTNNVSMVDRLNMSR
jgi:hypothetical protein